MTHQYVPVTFRRPTPECLSFIYSSWLKSFRIYSRWAKAVPAQIYFGNHKRVVQKLLEDSGVLIACNPECPDQIFGYAVYQPTAGGVAVLHYLYVKQPYRKMGIATALFREALHRSEHRSELPVAVTHIPDREFREDGGARWTSMWDRLRDKWSLVFNPYILGSEFFYDSPTESKAG